MNEEQKNETIYENDHVEIKYEDSKGKNFEVHFGKGKSKAVRKLEALIPLLCVIAFLILGFCFGLWHPGWAVFLLIPVLEMLIGLIGQKGKALAMGLTVSCCVIAFIVMGIFFHLWHPGWLVFLIIPVVGVIVD